MFQRILVAVDIDYPRIAEAVYRRAAELAGLCGAEVRLVAVLPGFGMPLVASFVPQQTVREGERRLRAAMEEFIRERADPSVSYTIRTGKSWEEIVAAAEEWGADLVVVYYNRHREINEAFSRSAAQNVADHAPCSVLRLRNVVPDGG